MEKKMIREKKKLENDNDWSNYDHAVSFLSHPACLSPSLFPYFLPCPPFLNIFFPHKRCEWLTISACWKSHLWQHLSSRSIHNCKAIWLPVPTAGKLVFLPLCGKKGTNKLAFCVTAGEEHLKPIMIPLVSSCRWGQDDGSAGCTSTSLLWCLGTIVRQRCAFIYSTHIHSFYIIQLLTPPESAKKHKCRMCQVFFCAKVSREFVRRGAEWCLNLSSGVIRGSAVIFTPTDDALTQKTVVIISVQRGVLTCGVLFLVFHHFLIFAGILNQFNSSVHKLFLRNKQKVKKNILNQELFVFVVCHYVHHFLASNLQLLLERILSHPRSWFMVVWW